MAISRTIDKQGRLDLGQKYANRKVLVEQVDETEFRVTMAGAIPKDEHWLHKNPKALAVVRKGLEEAKAGAFAKNPPDIAADAELCKDMGED